MRTISYWLSLIFIFTIPWEEIVDLGAFGNLGRLSGLVLALFWGITVVLANRIRKPHPFHAVFFLFIFWHVSSILWTIDFNYTLGRLQAYVQLLAMAYILWDLYSTRTAITSALQAYVLGAYVSIGGLLINFAAGNRIWYGRFSAGEFDPNNLGIIMALGIPMAWYVATGEGHGRLSGWLRIVNFIYIPSALLATSLTGSRASLIAAACAMIYVISGLSRLKLSTRIAVFVLLVAALVFLEPVIPTATLNRLGTTGSQIEHLDLNGRVRLWGLAVSVFERQPLLGIGSFAFRAATNTGRVAHNVFLTVLVEVGLIGFALFGLTMVMTVSATFKHKRSEFIFWVAILVTLTAGLFSLNWAHRKHFWLIPILIVASANVSTQEVGRSPTEEEVPGYSSQAIANPL